MNVFLIFAGKHMYSQLSPCGQPAITDAAITDKIQILAKAIEVWLEMTSAITELQTFSWYQNDNFIVLKLDKANTTYFS